MKWNENMSKLINYGLNEYPFPLGIPALMILIPPAFIYYLIKDTIDYTQKQKEKLIKK